MASTLSCTALRPCFPSVVSASPLMALVKRWIIGPAAFLTAAVSRSSSSGLSRCSKRACKGFSSCRASALAL